MNEKMDKNNMGKRSEYLWKKKGNRKELVDWLVMNMNEILRNDFDWKGGIRGVILVFWGSRNSMNEYDVYDF